MWNCVTCQLQSKNISRWRQSIKLSSYSKRQSTVFGLCNTQTLCALFIDSVFFPPWKRRCCFSCAATNTSVFLSYLEPQADRAFQVSLWEHPAVFGLTVLTPTGLGLFTSTAQTDEAEKRLLFIKCNRLFKLGDKHIFLLFLCFTLSVPLPLLFSHSPAPAHMLSVSDWLNTTTAQCLQHLSASACAEAGSKIILRKLSFGFKFDLMWSTVFRKILTQLCHFYN